MGTGHPGFSVCLAASHRKKSAEKLSTRRRNDGFSSSPENQGEYIAFSLEQD